MQVEWNGIIVNPITQAAKSIMESGIWGPKDWGSEDPKS